MNKEYCVWCWVEYGSRAGHADEYCYQCGEGYCIECVQDGALVFDDDDVLVCEDCHRASLPQRAPVIATVVLAGYYDAARFAVEGVVDPRTGSRVHQREVE